MEIIIIKKLENHLTLGIMAVPSGTAMKYIDIIDNLYSEATKTHYKCIVLGNLDLDYKVYKIGKGLYTYGSMATGWLKRKYVFQFQKPNLEQILKNKYKEMMEE